MEISDNAVPWGMGDTHVQPLGFVTGTIQVQDGEEIYQVIKAKLERLKPHATHFFGCLTQKVSAKEAQLDLFHFPGSEYYRFSGYAYRKTEETTAS